MNDNISYLTDTSKISLEKMNFTVINLRPKDSDKCNDTKLDIERKLFDIFKKYVDKH
ncbi:MAG: hypothetical protein SOS24_00475 [Clostridia bacterium]|nr:hypothetical protein [Clostridia bacterium]